MMPVCFMSEHIAEFILVPDLICRLKLIFPYVVPFYYWASREGSRLVATGHKGYVRIVAAYARRPKIDTWGQCEIDVKVNKELFDHATVLESLGIPVLAGAPCISQLTDCTLNAACIWFLLGTSHTHEDAIVRVDVKNPKRTLVVHDSLQGPLEDKDLCDAILQRSTLMPWPDAFNQIRLANRTLGKASPFRYRFFGAGTIYRPFYLALLT